MSSEDIYGKYRLVQKVASGGMAEVFLARSSSIGGFEKLLAIKRMHPKLGAHSGFVSLFIEEAKLWVALNHPNIVHVFDFGRVDENYYIAMEFVDGVDLAYLTSAARNHQRPIPVESAVYMMRQVYEGMAYAHDKKDHTGKAAGVVHRDISPHNILLSFEGQVKISDFGIAKAVEKLEQEAQGEVVGKLAYIAPEQSMGELSTPQSDIWSGGVILHELLTNKRLFSRDTDQETLEALRNADIPPIGDESSPIPQELEELIEEILTRDPKARIKTAREVADRLSDILSANYPRQNALSLSSLVSIILDDPNPSILNALDDGESSKPILGQHDERTGKLTPTEGVNSDISSTLHAVRNVDEEVIERIRKFEISFAESPSLWTLADIADCYFELQRPQAGFAGYELAAAKFMQSGLIVQALTLLSRLATKVFDSQRVKDCAKKLPKLVGLNNEELYEQVIAEQSAAHFEEYLLLLEDETKISNANTGSQPAELLGKLSSEQLELVFENLNFIDTQPNQILIQTGDSSHSFYWIGRGRVIFSTKNYEDKRVYLTSLSDGDCFGEQSFFSGLPHEFTIETTEKSWILSLEKEYFRELLNQFPETQSILRSFYISRIAESLIAKSELLGSMSVVYRRRLAQKFQFRDIKAGDVIIREGEISDSMYAIKAGTVRVTSTRANELLNLAELGPGDIFGEIAALKGIARTATVHALEDCELLCLRAGDLKAFLEKHTEIKKKVEEQIKSRADETARLLVGDLVDKMK